MITSFGEYLPDLPELENPGATVALNVVPRTAKSYGPFNDLAVLSDALAARCQGMFSAVDDSGNVYTFAGDAGALYKADSNLTWSDVSDTTTSSTYVTATDDYWKFVQYGNRVIATNFFNDVQTFVVGTDSQFTDLDSANAPKARHIAIIRNWVFLGNTNDGVDGNVPHRVWWSGFDDPTSWPTVGGAAAAAAQSDYQDLPGYGWCQGLVGAVGGTDGAAFMENGIFRITYEGPPTVFRFDHLEGARGTPAPGSITQVGALVYYLGEDGFYVFDGSNSIPIGAQKVDRTFFDDADQTLFHRISSTADPVKPLIFWSYVSQSSADGEPDKILIYNWEIRRWSLVEKSHQIIGRSIGFGYTLEGLDVFGNMDTLPYSLDSRYWAGGAVNLSAFDTSNKLGNFNGDALEATLETGEFSGDDRRLFITGVRPLVDGGTVTAAIGTRDAPDGTRNWSSLTPPAADGVCPQRQSARYVKARVSIAAAGMWEHAQGIEPRVRLEGRR